jgi:hypothetical protein
VQEEEEEEELESLWPARPVVPPVAPARGKGKAYVVHFSSAPELVPLQPLQQQKLPARVNVGRVNPLGFFACRDSKWLEHCQDMSEHERVKYTHVACVDMRNVLVVKTEAEAAWLTRAYAGSSEGTINWDAIRDDGFAGVEVCEDVMQIDIRLRHVWLYNLDIPCFIIWDTGVVRVAKSYTTGSSVESSVVCSAALCDARLDYCRRNRA